MRTVLTGLLVLVAVTGCGKKGPPPNVPPAAAPPPASVGAPVTAAEAAAFAAGLTAAPAGNNAAEFDRLFGQDAMFERSIADLNLSAESARGVRRGARESSRISAVILSLIQKGAKYKLLRVRESSEGARPILRLILPDSSGINYHEFTLARSPDGVGVADVLVYLSGESLTTTFRRSLIPMAQAEAGGGGLKTNEALYAKHSAAILAFSRANREARYADALKTFRTFPVALQKDRALRALAVGVAEQVSAADHAAEVEAFAADHPGAPNLPLLLIAYHTNRKNYAAARAAVDDLIALVGPDPYLTVQRANVFLEEGDLTAAAKDADAAAAAEPALAEAHYLRIAIALRRKSHAATLEGLRRLAKDAGQRLSPDDLAAMPDYADFVKSPQFDDYKKWFAER